VKEVLRTNDPVKLSYAQSLLRDADIEPIVLDQGMSSMYGGGLPVIRTRIMVIDEDADEAARLLAELQEDGA
jgi:putative signal transducing protein